MYLSFREGAKRVLQDYPQGLHYKELMKKMLDENLVQSEGKNPELTINSIINQDIKLLGIKSDFAKHVTDRGVFLLRIYNQTATTPDQEPVATDISIGNVESDLMLFDMSATGSSSVSSLTHEDAEVSKQQKGTGGELAVSSELLFNGFNTSIPNVDDGVDIIAVKNDTFYYIQVKTSLNQQSKHPYRIRKESFHRFNQSRMYYVFVMRKLKSNTYLVIHNDIIATMISQGHIKLSTNGYYCVDIKKDGTGRTMAGFNVNDFINNWGLIA